MADRLTGEQRSYCMSRIRSKDTKIELLLRSMLFRRGLRYRIHYGKLPGKPDVVFPKNKLAVFVDGDFWHGRNFEKRKKTYSDYWYNKIRRNIERDKRVDEKLKDSGWDVFRIWGKDLKKNPEKFVDKIEDMVRG